MTASAPRHTPALPDDLQRVHIVGICGTAMGSLAAMLKERGLDVRGSDLHAYPPMSTWLHDRGLTVLPGYDPAHLDWNPQLVIVGNVARPDNPQSVAAQQRHIPTISLPEALKLLFFPHKRTLVVTGTHGKTTTSSLLAWTLTDAGLDPNFLIGGVTGNFSSNYRLADGPLFVIEGDEYDSAWFDKVPKFWHYQPSIATINNIEFDHFDIYPDLDAIVAVFSQFAALLPSDGQLWVNGDDPLALSAARAARCPVHTFGLGPGCDLRPTQIQHHSDGVDMRLRLHQDDLGLFRSPLPGLHNVRNWMGALALALAQGVTPDQARRALPRFLTTRKRQELRGLARGVLVYDDFAHHPTAVRETLDALRLRHPDARLWAVFEAKSNTSRAAVFQQQWPASFASADQVILSAPWKQDDHLPQDQKIDLPRVAREIEALGVPAALLPAVPDIIDLLDQRLLPGDVVVGLSGSNFSNFHDLLLQRLQGAR
jgi:UDP-N-acetylmuramate: L-alanyl-gamma-D-glutamyl-meso-diaminopimelate ligase